MALLVISEPEGSIKIFSSSVPAYANDENEILILGQGDYLLNWGSQS